MGARRTAWGVMLVAGLVAAAPAGTTAQGLRFTRLGLRDGLSQASGYALAQDNDGFLWVGTQNGVNRYDGVSFRSSWTTNGEESPVSFAEVRALFADAEGHLWVGVNGMGLYLYDRMREDFDTVAVSAAGPGSPTLPKRFFGFTEMAGTVLVATDVGIGSIRWDSAGASLHLDGRLHAHGCSPAVTALRVAGDTLWVGTLDGCVLTELAGTEDHGTVVARLDARVKTIAPGPAGVVYVGTEGKGLFVFGRDGRLRGTAGPSGVASGTDRVTSVLTMPDGDTWLGTLGGLGLIPSGRADTTWFGMGSGAAGALPNEDVESLYRDHTGVLWIGTWRGLARLSPWYRGIHFIPERTDQMGEPVGGVVSILPDGSGRLLTGSLGGAVTHVARSSMTPGVVEKGTPELADIHSMAWGRNGDLWVGTQGTGVYRRTRSGWRSYHVGRTAGGSTSSDYVSAVFVDHAGVVWAGTNRSGLYVYDPKSDRFNAFTVSGPSHGLDTSYVWPIREDGDGALWFGKNRLGGGGLFRLGVDRRTLDFFATGSGAGAHANDGRVLTILLSGDTLVWFGTQGGGLGRLDPRTGDLRFYTTRDGLPHDNVEGILKDRSGKLWISTNAGLARFDPTTEEFWVLGAESGIQAGRFFANSAYAADDGLLYFGGPNGITVIDPSRLAPSRKPPPIAIVGFRVRGVERADVTNASARSGIEMRPGENFFTIEFTGLDFAEPERTRLQYRLDPLETRWVDAGAGRSARYTDVRPGRYRFLVRARSSAGAWNRAGLTIPIVVQPPITDTLWFRASLLAVLAGILAAGYRYRRKQHERVRAMRLQIAGELHDDIGANLSAIALKSDLVRRVGPEDTRGSPVLADIQRLTHDTMHKVREMIWVVKEEHDTVQGLVTRMEDAAGALLGGVIDFSFSIDPTLPSAPLGMAVRQDVYRVFKEALQNVMKHAGPCRVEIQVLHARSELLIHVSDDGCGFEEDRVKPGTGLKLMRMRNRREGVRVEVSSSPGSGTRVAISAKI